MIKGTREAGIKKKQYEGADNLSTNTISTDEENNTIDASERFCKAEYSYFS